MEQMAWAQANLINPHLLEEDRITGRDLYRSPRKAQNEPPKLNSKEEFVAYMREMQEREEED